MTKEFAVPFHNMTIIWHIDLSIYTFILLFIYRNYFDRYVTKMFKIDTLNQYQQNFIKKMVNGFSAFLFILHIILAVGVVSD